MLPLSAVLRFLNCGVESRCFVEAERLLAARHLLLVGVKGRDGNDVNVIALCLRTAGIHENPHSVEVCLSFEDSAGEESLRVLRSSCSCTAGLSEKCKHVSALLLHCYRNGLASLRDLSCTDIECEWSTKKKASKQMYDTVPLDMMCHVTREAASPLPYETLAHLANLLRRSCPDCAVEQHRKRQRTECDGASAVCSMSQGQESPAPLPLMSYLTQSHVMTMPLEELYKDMRSHYAVPDKIEELTREQAESRTWHDYRRGVVTASVAHTCMTRSTSLLKGPRPVNLLPFLDVVLRTKVVSTKQMREGSAKQHIAEMAYVNYMRCQDHDVDVKKVGLVLYKDIPFIGCSPDGIVEFTCECCASKRVILEIKCPVKIENSFTNYSKRKIKRDYATQMNVQMGICGVYEAHFFVFVDTLCFELEKVMFNATDFASFCKVICEVYDQYVLTELRQILCT
ncbi:uncharacterized protein LOC135392609 [Ornithodoros turicata]|uniref:uncharacterized protein LOC135392609 n=1 Tax=Ornithodoros turicata TaxID=34597 RepID=UPI0031393333